MALTRREMLKLGIAGSAAVALPLQRVVSGAVAQTRIAESSLPAPFTVPFAVPPVITPHRTDATTDYYMLTQKQSTVQILPGINTPVWGYNGIVPGPTIDVQQGRQVLIRQVNKLPDRHPIAGYQPWTSTHLHGSPSLPQFDGYASDITRPGQYKDYRYSNTESARTLWYHDHGVHHTAENAYMGLAAFYRLHDPLEVSLPIPKGNYDIPLMIHDAMFATDGQLIGDDHDHSGIMGDVILVNGRPWPVMQVEQRKYRFRILVGSMSRSYRLKLDSGQMMTVIAGDGGFMPVPQPVSVLRTGMAERYEVIIDFANIPIGQRVVMRNLPRSDSDDNNISYTHTDKVMAFDVVAPSSSSANNEIPAVLDPNNPVMALQPAQAVARRTMKLDRSKGQWTINGTSWADVVASGYKKVMANPKLNDIEIWTIENASGGWFHPLHIHLVDFKILDRNGLPPLPQELGPKDVVYVGENETVRLIMRFGPHLGKYMIHCHNMVHEDHDMMTQFEVGTGGPDPIRAALPKWGSPPAP